MCFFFFFFKQKTAYEMRISDWSSDVCSSDLLRNYMDSLVLITALAATVWAMLRLAQRPDTGTYGALALAVAAGTLGKFSYPPALLCLLAAAGVSPRMREAQQGDRKSTRLNSSH